MSRYLNQTAAMLAAVLVTVASINAIVTVPPVDTATYAASIMA